MIVFMVYLTFYIFLKYQTAQFGGSLTGRSKCITLILFLPLPNTVIHLSWSGGLVVKSGTSHIYSGIAQFICKDTSKEIQQILRIKFTLYPSIFILGIVPDNIINRDLFSSLRTLLLIAKEQ